MIFCRGNSGNPGDGLELMRGLVVPWHSLSGEEKAARDLEAKAAGIDATVFDLKAVNPNIVVKVDTRTPQEIIANIDEQGRIVSEALASLSGLLAVANE